MNLVYKLKKRLQIILGIRGEMEYRIEEYRQAGIRIGDRCKIYSLLSKNRDCVLLEIGDDVTIAGGVTFLNHDNAIIKPTKGKYTDILGEIHIGDRCFIGQGSIILPGVLLAEDTIVGAGSVVTKSVVQPGWVIAGNPAQAICTVEQYVEKNKGKMVNLDNRTKEDLLAMCKNNSDVLITRPAMKCIEQ